MRRLAVILVSLWLGAALLFVIVVAPTAFRVLPLRSLAGALVGGVLPTLFWCGVVAAGVAALIAQRARLMLPLAVALVMMTAAAVGELGPGQRIRMLRMTSGVAIDSLPTGHPVRARFGRLHGISVVLLGVAMAAATTLLITFPTGEKGVRRSEINT